MHRAWLVSGLMFVSMAVYPAVAPAKPAATQPSKASKAASSEAVKSGSEIARFHLEGEVPETAKDLALLTTKRPVSFEKWLRRLAQARNDSKVCAAVIEFGDFQAGWGQMQELRAAISRLREVGKPVYAFLTDADLHNYSMATACDKIVLAPAGHLMIPGMHLQMWFYKDLLDKLGVQVDVLHIGAYKGAGEPYTRTQPSEEARGGDDQPGRRPVRPGGQPDRHGPRPGGG